MLVLHRERFCEYLGTRYSGERTCVVMCFTDRGQREKEKEREREKNHKDEK